MYHCRKIYKFSRFSAHRNSMLINLTKSLIKYECITTTLSKAKNLRSVFERVITITKGGDGVNKKRRILAIFKNNLSLELMNKLFNELAIRYKNRNGGYTRILKNGIRRGDCAPMAYVLLL